MRVEKAISHLRGAADDKLERDGSNRKRVGGCRRRRNEKRMSIYTAELGKDGCLACYDKPAS